MNLRAHCIWIWFLLGLLPTVSLSAVQAPDEPTVSRNAVDEVAAIAGDDADASIPWRVAQNTVVLALGVVAVSLPIGTLLAILLTRTDVAGRRGAIAVVVLLLFLPLYVQLAGWEAAFGKLGWLTATTRRPLLVGLQGVIFVHAMAAVPWVALIVSVGLYMVRRADEEVALLDAPGSQVLLRIVLPQLAPFLLIAAAWGAVSAIGEMTVSNIYLVAPGDYTLAEQVYMTLQSQPLETAVRQLVPWIAAAAAMVLGGLVTVGKLFRLRERTAEDRQPPLQYQLGGWRLPATFLVWLLLGLQVGLPVASLMYKAGQQVVWNQGLPESIWSASQCAILPWTSLWSMRGDVLATVGLGACAAGLAVVLALILSPIRPDRQGAKWFIASLAALAWAIPGPIVGLGIISLFHQNIPGSIWLYHRTDLPTIMALTVRIAPLVLLVVGYAVDRFPKSVLESASLDGAGPWTTLWRIIVPQRMPALAVAWITGFALATGDLSWSILVLRPGIDTIQRRMFGDIHAGADDRVAAACLGISVFYMLAAAVMLWAVRRFERSSRAF